MEATMNTTAMPDDTKLPGHEYTLGEMRETIRTMREINGAFYASVFTTNMASRCHAFVEFCGLQAKFIDMCEEALVAGIEFPRANQHTGESMDLNEHHAEYLGDKFACIYGFAMSPHMQQAFVDVAFGTASNGTEREGV